MLPVLKRHLGNNTSNCFRYQSSYEFYHLVYLSFKLAFSHVCGGNDTSKAKEIIDSSYYWNRTINNHYESESFLLKYFSSHMSTPSHIPILPQNPLSYTYYIDKSVYLHDEIILIIKIFIVMIIVVITLIQKYFS